MNPENKRPQGGSRPQNSPRPQGGSRPAPRQPQQQRPPKPKRSRAQIIRHRILIAATVIAAIIVLAFAVYQLTFVKPRMDSVDVPQIPITSDSPDSELSGIPPKTGNRKADFYTFLVIGRDTGGGGNTDAMLLVAYDVKKQQLNIMSIPRDTMVNLPYDIKRINSVYNHGGMGDEGIKALNKEVSQLVGFIPNFQIIVEWDAVGELVNAIGGVTFDVPRNMNYDDPDQNLHIHLKKGVQELDGNKAMQVIRYRHDNDMRYGYPDGDLGRIKTQQAFLKVVIEQCLQFKNVAKIGELAEIFNKNVTTNLTVNNLLWFGKEAIMGGLTMDNVNFFTMPNVGVSAWSRTVGNYQSYVTPVTDELVDLINQYFNPFEDDLKANELDIMYMKDGKIYSTTGVVEDKRANEGSSSGSSHSNQTGKPVQSKPPEPVDTPDPSATPDPDVTPDPNAATSPAVTSDPNATDTPDSVPSPDQGQPPAVTVTPGPIQSDQPLISAAPMPSPDTQPAPTPAVEAPLPPPEA